MPLAGRAGKTVEVSIRSADGSPLSDDKVNEAFAAATATVTGNTIVYLTHSTKTGLIAPSSPPDGANVIVDACQARIGPEIVVAYLRRGWPVVVTGSKFFGGPAFSGAVLFPRARLLANRQQLRPDGVKLGTALRWMATLPAIEAFEPMAANSAEMLASRAAAMEKALQSNPALAPVGGCLRTARHVRMGQYAQHFHLWERKSRETLDGCFRRQNCDRSTSTSRARVSCLASRSAWAPSVGCESQSVPGTCWVGPGVISWRGFSARWRARCRLSQRAYKKPVGLEVGFCAGDRIAIPERPKPCRGLLTSKRLPVPARASLGRDDDPLARLLLTGARLPWHLCCRRLAVSRKQEIWQVQRRQESDQVA